MLPFLILLPKAVRGQERRRSSRLKRDWVLKSSTKKKGARKALALTKHLQAPALPDISSLPPGRPSYPFSSPQTRNLVLWP